jgi:hypothetical protein
MRRSKALCVALAVLNLAVFLAPFSRLEKPGLEVRVPKTAKTADAGSAVRNTIVFRAEGVLPPPPPAPEPVKPVPEPVPTAVSDAPIDTGTMLFLGSMTSAEGRVSYFFKNRMTNRVYASSAIDGGVKIVSQTDKEFVLEIDGAQYKVIR